MIIFVFSVHRAAIIFFYSITQHLSVYSAPWTETITDGSSEGLAISLMYSVIALT